VVVTGSMAERALAARVAGAAGLGPDAVLAGRTGVADLAALVAGARLVVCGDTGVGHLATAYGTPSVVLFGPVPPRLWGPPPDRPWHRALWPGPASAGRRGRRRRSRQALRRIRVDDVLDAAVRALAAAPSAAAAP
jgi:ADP-heptose:LPS heptosyltransferase